MGEDRGYIPSCGPEHGAEFTTLVGVVDGLSNIVGSEGDESTESTGLFKEIEDAVTATIAEANAYTDSKVDGKFDISGAAAQALADAKSYVDGKDTTMNTRVTALESHDHSVYAKTSDVYNKTAVDSAVAAAEAAAKADAATKLAGYYTKSEIDNLFATNSTADQTYAKTYTDQLYDSFKFAQNSDIDALFT